MPDRRGVRVARHFAHDCDVLLPSERQQFLDLEIDDMPAIALRVGRGDHIVDQRKGRVAHFITLRSRCSGVAAGVSNWGG